MYSDEDLFNMKVNVRKENYYKSRGNVLSNIFEESWMSLEYGAFLFDPAGFSIRTQGELDSVLEGKIYLYSLDESTGQVGRSIRKAPLDLNDVELNTNQIWFVPADAHF